LKSGCDPDDALEVDGIYQQQPADDDDDHMSEACSREGHVSQVRERPSVTPTSRTIIHSL